MKYKKKDKPPKTRVKKVDKNLTKKARYWIPEDVYKRVMADLTTPDEKKQKTIRQCKSMCLERMPINKTLKTPFTRPAIMEATKLAFEKRDWKNVYMILLQCLKSNDNLLIYQTLQYMFAALTFDPIAKELDSLRKFLMGCRLCKTEEDMETFIKNAYTLYKESNKESLDPKDETDGPKDETDGPKDETDGPKEETDGPKLLFPESDESSDEDYIILDEINHKVEKVEE